MWPQNGHHVDTTRMTETNFTDTLKVWKARSLTWYGKITILKSLGLSKLNYAIMSLHVPTPEWFVKSVQHEINAFLWNNKPQRIKFLNTVDTHKAGGLALTHFENSVLEQKANWVKRLFDAAVILTFTLLSPKYEIQ